MQLHESYTQASTCSDWLFDVDYWMKASLPTLETQLLARELRCIFQRFQSDCSNRTAAGSFDCIVVTTRTQCECVHVCARSLTYAEESRRLRQKVYSPWYRSWPAALRLPPRPGAAAVRRGYPAKFMHEINAYKSRNARHTIDSPPSIIPPRFSSIFSPARKR